MQVRLTTTLRMAVLLMILGSTRLQGQQIIEINPSQSDLWATDPDGASGGRVNHVGMAPLDKAIVFAASEWGGIYKSTDGGDTWLRMNGHHPTVTWDVKVSPVDSNRVIATSFYDGRVNSISGINVSTDGGKTWIRPSSATPPEGFCTSPTQREEPSAFGISFDPDDPRNVYVGTNCGLAVSNNGGSTWHYVDPTPSDRADSVWAVIVHHKGIIDTCGDDGHRRSTNGGITWTSTSGNGTPLPSGRCSIAASPEESYVLFVVVGTSIFESDDGGGNWISNAYQNPAPQGRIPFVKTNSRSKNDYDLWFGDVSLYRASCVTPSPPVQGGNKRCQESSSWAGGFTRDHGSHDDFGDIAFDPVPDPNAPSCPLIMSSDGGIFVNTLGENPECQAPKWKQPKITPHALWLFGMNETHASTGSGQLLYLASQDNGTFASTNAQTNSPAWSNKECCDSFDVAVDTTQVLYTSAWYDGPRGILLFLRSGGMNGGDEIKNYPAGNLVGWKTPDIIDRFANNAYVLLTDAGVFVTSDITLTPISWMQLGPMSPQNGCAVHATASQTDPKFFVEAGSCTGSQPDQIWRYDGLSTTGTWQQIKPPTGFTGFGVFAVDKHNPDRLFASVLGPNSVQMVFSANGGASWTNLRSLDGAMTGGGAYKYMNASGPTDFTGLEGYAQPSLIAFSPFETKTLVAAGADSGVFLSRDAGNTWKKITDNSGTTDNPDVPRAKFAAFDRGDGTFSVFIGTQGRGAWRINYPQPIDCR